MNSQALKGTVPGGAISGTTANSSKLQRALIPTSHYSDLGRGYTAVAYLISGILFWGGAGYLLDGAIGTSPWFTAIGALVGNFAGIYLLYLRMGREVQSENKKLFGTKDLPSATHPRHKDNPNAA